MSFGFGPGDFADLFDRAKAIVDACRSGPPELRELSREVETLQTTMSRLKEDSENPTSLLRRKGQSREKDMKQITANLREILEEIQAFVDKHSTLAEPTASKHGTGLVKRVWHAYNVGSADLDNMRSKLTFYTSTIDLFLDSLGAAALGRIEHKLDSLVAHLIAASAEKNGQMLDDDKSILSLANPIPDASAWNVLRSELVAAGISETDIEDHKDRIVSYAKGLITGSLSESDATVTIMPSAQSSSSSPVNVADQRQAILRELNVLAMRNLHVGKASVDLAIDSVHYGTYKTFPACLIVIECRFTSMQGYNLIAGHIFCSLGTNAGKAKSTQSILNYAPEVQYGGARDVWTGSSISIQPEMSGPGLSVVGSSWSKDNRQLYQVPAWFLITVMKPGNRTVEWHVRSPKYISSTYLNCSLKLALIIGHSGEPFTLEIERSGTLKSSLRRLTAFGIRKEPVSLPFQPEENDSILDDIDIEALTAPPDTVMGIYQVTNNRIID